MYLKCYYDVRCQAGEYDQALGIADEARKLLDEHGDAGDTLLAELECLYTNIWDLVSQRWRHVCLMLPSTCMYSYSSNAIDRSNAIYSYCLSRVRMML